MATIPLTTPRAPGTERSAGFKFLIMMLAGFLLALPILSIYLLNYDRQSRSEEARASISEGWGGEQTVSAPVLVIPYRTRVTETVEENGKSVQRTRTGTDDLVIEASVSDVKTAIRPERRQRSIYEAVVYGATNTGTAQFSLPDDLAEDGIPLGALIMEKAQLRFAIADVRGLQGGGAKASLGGKDLKLLPGQDISFSGFYAKVDASAIASGALDASYSYIFRGTGALSLNPKADETSWSVTAPWGSPSFTGDFLPTSHRITNNDFSATWTIGGLSLGGLSASNPMPAANDGAYRASESGSSLTAQVTLFEPADIYGKIDRATKYGFLFIGFTFVTFLMFDVIGGVRVSLVEYLLVGAGLVMFFVLLLAMAEVAGFGAAYAVASAAIIGLITAYSAAVLKSWGRAKWIGAMLSGLYAVLYVLLSLDEYSLLIGALLLFVALAGVMYLTRNVDWGAKKLEETVLP
jgi:inner membrane protein